MKLYMAQFISIFIMAILGVYIYAGVSSEWNGLMKAADDFYQQTNFANAWIYGQSFTEEAVDKVSKVAEVTGVERRMSLKGIGEFDNKPTLQLHFVEKNQVNTFLVLEGEQFSLDEKGIWLDRLFADANGLKVGDKFNVTFYGYTMEVKIKGLIMSPEYVYTSGEDDLIPNRANFGYGFLSVHSFPSELPTIFTDLMITTEKEVDRPLQERIELALEQKYSVFIKRAYVSSYLQFGEEIKEHKAMGQIFPIAFLAVAMLTMVTTMGRLVNNQRTQIGILKAMGFRRRKILFHYVSYGLWISVFGAILGVIAGPLTLPYLFYGPMQTAYTLPVWRHAIPMSVYFMALLSVVGCTLVTYLACKNVLKDTPAQSLRPKAPKDIRHSIIDRSNLWKRLNFHMQWNIRDSFRCKGRSFMAIVGIMGCSALLICAFGMQDTFDYLVEWNYKQLNLYETRIELKEEINEEDITYIKEKTNGEAIREGAVELKANGINKSGELLVIDEVTLIQFQDINSNTISLPKDQISISNRMAELLNVGIGDMLSWHIYGEEDWKSSKIGAIYRTPFTQGMVISKQNYESHGYQFLPTTIISPDHISSNYLQEGERGVKKLLSKLQITQSYEKMAEAMNLLVYILMLAAVILAVVVIYNLGVMSFTERQREISTLKVIGFQTKKLRSLLLYQNLWLTIIGILPGLVIGIWILQYIFHFVGELFDFVIQVSVSSFLYTIVWTLFISISVNRIFSRKVKEIDMVSSLKGVE